MEKLDNIFSTYKEESEKRFKEFKIESINSLIKITDDTYLEKPTWLGGDEKYACIFIDLNHSSLISNIKQKSTVAKIYDYFTQNVTDFLSEEGIKADYIDIKGDGVFGLFEGSNSIFKAFVAGVTFKTFFSLHIAERFKTDYDITLNCKIALDYDKILVRKIGRRKFYNEVWAGKLINNTINISTLDKKIKDSNNQFSSKTLVIVSELVFSKLKEKEKYTIKSCGHSNGIQTNNHTDLWNDFIDNSEESKYKGNVYYLDAQWCSECGDEYLNKILE
jgi:hypothetical protein